MVRPEVYPFGLRFIRRLFILCIGDGISIGRMESDAVQPLIPNANAAAADYFARTGIYPVAHCVAIKRALVDEHPWLPLALFEAFAESKRIWLETASHDERLAAGSGILRAADPLVFGVEAHHAALLMLLDSSHAQGMHAGLTLDDLFEPSTRHSSGQNL